MIQKRKAKSIMIQGTGSDVGKTVLVAGLCRLATRKGLSVLPFKPQNMSNNAAVADIPLDDGGGGEVARAQWLQALACHRLSHVDMNPVLLKPQSDLGSQIIVHGKLWKTANGRDYQSLKPHLMNAVMESYRRLCEQADLVIVEGAGSPAELNLRVGDIANMGFATKANVPVILVGDIDRGGVIASLVGTHTILSNMDRKMVCGYLINKFRGDLSVFDKGIDHISELTGWPCFGIIPWFSGANNLPAEDSFALERASSNQNGTVIVIVPVLSRISNFDDLDPLKLEPHLRLVFVRPGDLWPKGARLVILLGSKSTISDLEQFKALGWERNLHNHVRQGGYVLGLCGGYQMMGRSVKDPYRIEGVQKEAKGLGLLDVDTVLIPNKVVLNTKAIDVTTKKSIEGYEIHMGSTRGPDRKRPMILIGNKTDGAISQNGLCRGCYLHGLFSSDDWRRSYLLSLGIESKGQSYRNSLNSTLDELADFLELWIDAKIWEMNEILPV
ncbi:cobyric acid synthase [Candidatus Endowatersipora endosymbiont of Watersipora subatra]|uniref:cobyric acid synthase n=1 Tax=Candidatus Endowatersipora endosymbiont of Watersipora subatra TaxID=3077946 RepID=UPI00312CAE21